MTYGNINGFHPEPGSQGGSYNLAIIYHFGIATGFGVWFFMPATK